MAIYKDVTNHARPQNSGTLPLLIASNTLIRGGNTAGGTNGIYKSTDNGQTWTLKYTYATSGWNTRLRFIDSQGNIYIGTISSTVAGHIFRSSDSGENWTDVATSEASGWWRMTEDASGNLYASEYSVGNADASELYAYNVWRSTNHGTSWSKWHTEPSQTTPGAKDGIRHTHHITSDSQGRLTIGFGDIPAFSGRAGNAYQIAANGTLGSLISSTDNGFTAFAELSTGEQFYGGDSSPIKIRQYTYATNTITDVLDVASVFGSYYSSFIVDMCVGDDDVVYALTNGVTGSKPSVVLASADKGVTWSLIKYTNDLTGANFLVKNRSISGSRIYIGRAESNGVNFTSIPDFRRSEVAGSRVAVR